MPEFSSTSIENQERELVARVIAGDKRAGDEFIVRYQNRIYAVSVAILGWRDPEAEDAVQETFIAALAALSQFEFRSSIYTWLNQICVRQCYRRIRARSRMALGTENDLAEILGATASQDDGAIRQIDDERRAWLKQALETLDEACKGLILHRDFEGMSYGDLARKLKAPIGTVMSRLSRCREKLKERARAWMNEAKHG